jgi:hypothetical protein
MLRRSLHQRKSFWLGLFVLLFLGWAWFSSIHRAHKLRIGSPLAPGCVVLWQSQGTMGVARYHEPSEWTLICNELLVGAVTGPASLWQDRHGKPRFSIPAPIMGGWSEEGCGMQISHWFLMLLHIAGLSAWIRWRIRREHDFADPAKEVAGGLVPQCPGDRSSTTPLA